MESIVTPVSLVVRKDQLDRLTSQPVQRLGLFSIHLFTLRFEKFLTHCGICNSSVNRPQMTSSSSVFRFSKVDWLTIRWRDAQAATLLPSSAAVLASVCPCSIASVTSCS
jgi:hypothetical protein